MENKSVSQCFHNADLTQRWSMAALTEPIKVLPLKMLHLMNYRSRLQQQISHGKNVV